MLDIALLHYPVLNREGKVVATSVVNMDLHDIARAAKTFGVAKFYVITPIAQQRRLAEEIMNHWRQGYGATFNPCRKEAFEIVSIQPSLEDTLLDIAAVQGRKPWIIATGANLQGKGLTCRQLKQILQESDFPCLLIFGTGSGLAENILKSADYHLESIRGIQNYNHLSVRSAVAIILDRVTNTI